MRVYEDLSNKLREYMLPGLLDTCTAPFDEMPVTGYKRVTLLREPFVLVGSRPAGMRPDEPVPLERLSGLNLVLPAHPNLLRAFGERSMLRPGMDFRLLIESSAPTLGMDLAVRGLGFTIVPACALYKTAVESSITWAPIQELYLDAMGGPSL